jgi:hypothetical protein
MTIPELISLCARELARQAREMSQQNRYNFLRSIPDYLRVYVNAYPTKFLVWCEDEEILNMDIIKYYIHQRIDRKYFLQEYQKDCQYGITRRKVLLRKCANYYCDNTVFGSIIDKNYNIRYNCCNFCFIPSFIHMITVRKGIGDPIN